MKSLSDNQAKQMIHKISEFAHAKLSADETSLFLKFINLYYRHMAQEDFDRRSVEDLYGVIWSHWQLMQKRQVGELKINVYNPESHAHGFESTHTAIQLVTDDMPFLVDTLRMEINRMHLTTHITIHTGGLKVCRDAKGNLIDVHNYHAKELPHCIFEAPIYLEIDRQTSAAALKEIEENLTRVLKDVRLAVEDWPSMRQKMEAAVKDLQKNTYPGVEEEVAFLEWVLRDHFTFLGYRNYKLVGSGDEKALELDKKSGLGVLSDSTRSKKLRLYSDLPQKARNLALSKDSAIITSKTNTLSTVHRLAYTDYIGIKKFNAKGELIGQEIFVGLYTSVAYRSDPRIIPLLRQKVATVLKTANLPPKSHAAKDIVHILSTLPRDDLFHSSAEELYELATALSHLQERRRTRLFVRKDAFGRYFSCLVYVPRENFNTDLVMRIREILREALHGVDITYSTRVTESVLARIHYVVRIDTKRFPSVNFKELEAKIIEITESWQDGFRTAVLNEFGEERGNVLFNRYRHAFPAGYREVFTPQTAISDILEVEKLTEGRLGMSFYRPVGAATNVIRFKLYRFNETVPLSDALPMLENMGLRVVGEQPYRMMTRDGNAVWINDFSMTFAREPRFPVEEVKELFQDAFQNIWLGQTENDSFNRLVLDAELNWREIMILRSYAKYFRQIGFTFSDQYIANILVANEKLTCLIIQLFHAKFDPLKAPVFDQAKVDILAQIERAMEAVTSLDEDRIFNRYLDLIQATVRTNYYQVDENGNSKIQLSLKFEPEKIPEMPLPLPKYEIFVYSPKVEGIHLRMSKVARGGLRWSDRREDYRTEVLGLMKAQQVKNALIVPAGAKGGFVLKELPQTISRDDFFKAGVSGYQIFISGLLDITDNIVDGKIERPKNTAFYDDVDPYLVVAADKGTATFSDIANKIALDRGFWMGNAFASGGMSGYDHKKMAITARGAWVSAERHFQELGIDLNNAPITVVGIGDMSGDVFGNGMLLSPHMKLVAAFNNAHIFIDPTPDPAASFLERKRLFEMPRSTWQDYDVKTISKGGGIFSRDVKAIKLSEEIKTLLQVDNDKMLPSELIRAILKAPVDMIWNGGIGTYIKASSENNFDVGDRANDNLRINGNEVRSKVVCEGGNLGVTQLGRIEYSLNGGKINADFVDNSGGVDCSDHEVNIRILLNPEIASGEITERQSDALLLRMTDAVVQLVLEDNYSQNLAIGMAASVAPRQLNLMVNFMDHLVRTDKLNRRLEFLPDNEEIQKRRAEGKGLTRPEIAVLLAYSKNVLKAEILHSDLMEDPYLKKYVREAFPELLHKRFATAMEHHYLAKEIIATQVTNRLAAEMGATFVYQMQDETGCSTSEIVRAYMVSRKVFDLSSFYRDIESLDYLVDAKTQYELLLDAVDLVRRATRWLLRNRRSIEIEQGIEEFFVTTQSIMKRLPKLLLGADKEILDTRVEELIKQKVPLEIATKVASTMSLYHALNITEAAKLHNVEMFRVAKIYFMLVDRLQLLWFRNQVNNYPVGDHWTVLAKSAYKGDLDWAQRALTASVLTNTMERSIPGKVNSWLTHRETQIARWHRILTDLRNTEAKEFAILFVALRELLDLAKND